MPSTAQPQLTLSDAILARASTLLTEHGVNHGTLREGHPYLNLNASDRSHVFIKISRKGERADRAEHEIAGAQWAHKVGLLVPEPLIDHVLDLEDDEGELRAMSAWRWIQPVTASALRDQSRIAVELLVTICNTVGPDDAPLFDLTYFIDRVHTRMVGRTDEPSVRVTDTITKTAAIITSLIEPTRYTWIHGDLHFANLLWPVCNTPYLLDWESHTRGPIEFDVAQLLRSVALDFPQHTRDEKARAAARIRRHVDASLTVNWELVDAFIRFRAASSASHLLLHGHDPRKTALDLSMLDQFPFAA